LSKLRLVPYRDLRRVAEAAGFQWVRRRGSHNTFRSQAGRIVVIPDHGSAVIVRPLLRTIIAELGLSPDEYHRLLAEVR
jgi:predicted RNA binding protein YcfA (HicA-like mRNA interferase family)